MEDFLDEPIGRGLPNTAWQNFFAVPNSLDDADLDIYEFRIWCHLQRRSGAKRKAWPSIRTMSADLKISESTVLRSIKSLIEKRLLFKQTRLKEDGSPASNVYMCLAPEQGGVVSDRQGGGVCETPGVVSVALRKNIKVETNKENKEIGPEALITPKKEEVTKEHRASQTFMPPVAAQPKGMPDPDSIRNEVLRQGLTEEDGDYLVDNWLANGYRHGRNPVKDWRALIRSWKIQKYFPSQKKGLKDRTSKTDWSKY